MHLPLRLAFSALVAVSLVSCDSASSTATSTAGGAANLLMAPFSLLERTVSHFGGGSASVKEPDSTNDAIAERGKMIEQRDGTKPAPTEQQQQDTSTVASR